MKARSETSLGKGCENEGCSIDHSVVGEVHTA